MKNIEEIITLWLSKIILKIVTPEILDHFRKIEKINEKLIENQLHLEFNKCYIYTYIYNYITLDSIYNFVFRKTVLDSLFWKDSLEKKPFIHFSETTFTMFLYENNMNRRIFCRVPVRILSSRSSWQFRKIRF